MNGTPHLQRDCSGFSENHKKLHVFYGHQSVEKTDSKFFDGAKKLKQA
jgi:hypothetical protein